MNKFPVSLLRQLLCCMQDGLSIRVKAQKLGISVARQHKVPTNRQSK